MFVNQCDSVWAQSNRKQRFVKVYGVEGECFRVYSGTHENR